MKYYIGENEVPVGTPEKCWPIIRVGQRIMVVEATRPVEGLALTPVQPWPLGFCLIGSPNEYSPREYSERCARGYQHSLLQEEDENEKIFCGD